MFNEIDIHGLTAIQARTVLDKYLNTLPNGISEITVIHGYHHGTALQSFVRKKYTHKRCLRKMVSMNFGETILVLQNK